MKRNLSEKGKKILASYSLQLSKEVLEEEYNHNFLPERALAEKYGIPRQWLRLLMDMYQIVPMQKTARANAKSPKEFTPLQQDMVVGTLLGDAGVYERPSKTLSEPSSYYKVAHSVKQRFLTQHKSQILSNFPKREFEDPQNKNGKIFLQVGFATEAAQIWTYYRRLFYNSSGTKLWNPTIISLMNPRVLAYWFADDGSFDLDQRSSVGDIKLSNDLLTHLPEEADNLVALFSTWGLNFRHTVYPSIGLRTFVLERESQENFVNLISAFEIPGVRYKIPPQLRDLLDSSKKKFLAEMKYLWNQAKNSPLERETVYSLVYDAYQKYGFPFTTLSDVETTEILHRLKHYDPSVVLKGNALTHSVVGIDLVNSYYPHIWEARTRNNPSPMEVFKDPIKFRKAIISRVKHGAGFYPIQMVVGLRQYTKCPTNYPPLTARAVYERFVPSNGYVLDPCAGYGGRLLGALASKHVVFYRGLDPSEQTVRCADRMSADISHRYDKGSDDFRVLRATAEDWCPTNYCHCGFHLIFTSPPYFDQEIYSDEQNQVSHSCKTWDDYVLWCRKVTSNWFQLLKPGGYLIIHVSDTHGDKKGETLPMVSTWTQILDETQLTRKDPLSYDRPAGQGKRAVETLLVYQKEPTP
jgi:SAM-dependent methyltransferase